MIDFKAERSHGIWGWTDVERKELKEITDRINIALTDLKNKRFTVGVHLLELYNSKTYSIESRKYESGLCLPGSVGNCSSDYFFAYCLDKFDLEKSQVSRYMNIVDEFGDKTADGIATTFAPPWDKYGYSQLAEMLPLTKEQRENVKPDWSVRRIRDYKKSLVATSQQDSDEYNDAVSAEQKDKPIALPKRINGTRYERFKGLTPLQLCDRYIELEQEADELRAENERLERFYKMSISYDPELELTFSELEKKQS